MSLLDARLTPPWARVFSQIVCQSDEIARIDRKWAFSAEWFHRATVRARCSWRQSACARGLTFREIGAELGMSAPGARKAVKRGLALIAEQTAEAAEELRARESATLDAMAEAFLPSALENEPRAAEVLLKIRSAYRELNDLDLQRAPEDSGHTFLINTALPREVAEMLDEEDEPGELEAGEAG